MGVLALMMMTGCSSEFGKDGRIAKAVHQDSMDHLVITRCSDARRDEVCGNGKQHTKACLECGGAKK
jgi:hypothetical protein